MLYSLTVYCTWESDTSVKKANSPPFLKALTPSSPGSKLICEYSPQRDDDSHVLSFLGSSFPPECCRGFTLPSFGYSTLPSTNPPLKQQQLVALSLSMGRATRSISWRSIIKKSIKSLNKFISPPNNKMNRTPSSAPSANLSQGWCHESMGQYAIGGPLDLAIGSTMLVLLVFYSRIVDACK